MISSERMQEIRGAVSRLGFPDAPDDYDREDDLSALREAHWPIENAAWRRSDVTDVLVDWLDDPSSVIRRGTAVALGHVAPGILISEVATRIESSKLSGLCEPAATCVGDYAEGIGEAVWALGDHYFGDYGCPGYLDTFGEDSADREAEFERLDRICCPIIENFRGSKWGSDLNALVEGIRPVRTS